MFIQQSPSFSIFGRYILIFFFFKRLNFLLPERLYFLSSMQKYRNLNIDIFFRIPSYNLTSLQPMGSPDPVIRILHRPLFAYVFVVPIANFQTDFPVCTVVFDIHKHIFVPKPNKGIFSKLGFVRFFGHMVSLMVLFSLEP